MELLQFVHLVGLSMGLGGAIFADTLGLLILFSRRTDALTSVLKPVHLFVLAGLAVLWLSGAALAMWKFPLADLPLKVWVKLGLASVLLVNAWFIGRLLLPLASRTQKPLISHVGPRDIRTMVLCGSISLTCWLAALLIVKFSLLQQLPLWQLAGLIGLFWAVLASGIYGLLRLGRAVMRPAGDRRPSRARAQPLAANDDGPRDAGEGPEPQSAGISLSAYMESLGSDPIQPSGPSDAGTRRKNRSRRKRSPVFSGVAAAAGSLFARLAPFLMAGLKNVLLRAPSVKNLATRLKPTPAVPVSAPEAAHSLKAVLPECRKALIGIFWISAVTNLLMLTGPLFMLQIYDRVLTSRSIPTLAALILLVAVLFCFMGALELIRSRLFVRTGLRAERLLSRPVFDAVLRVGPAIGQMRTRVLRDLEHLRSFISGGGPAALFDAPWAPLYFLLIFMFHWVLGLIAVAGALVLAVLAALNEFASRAPAAKAANHSARANALAESGWRGSEVLHAMGMASRYRESWIEEQQRSLLIHVRASDIGGTFSTLIRVSRLFLQSMMLATGAYLAIQQAITPGVIIAASIIMSRALAPVEQLAGQWRGFLSARQGARRIAEVMAKAPGTPQRIELPKPHGYVMADNLYVSAPGSAQPILKGINFSLEPGDCLAVIGTNGSGKSTLARALAGAWPAQHGQVRLDGAALPQWIPEQLGANIGYLPQSVDLFEGTVAQNISRFDLGATPDEIVHAARKARVHDLILQLPDGYGTMLGEAGASLSGGQKQRIGLARAFYKNPAIVILDEPASNLDGEGEAALDQALETLRSEKTTIIIVAHKARTIAHANLALVLNNGRQQAFDAKDKILKPAAVQPVRQVGASSGQRSWRTA
ncbi:MAG: type I secretion system permease/ATPase [Pseudomonadota bacterium]